MNQCVESAVRTRLRTFRTGSDQTVGGWFGEHRQRCIHAEVAGNETRSSQTKDTTHLLSVLHHLYKLRGVYSTNKSSNVQIDSETVAAVCRLNGGKTLPCGDGAK